ncbi:protein of unknown function [Methylococcus capsulatus]|uniref:Uncharacterized protein n=1 Tax=Methylococcus capsulatus TaxID=414 RepID=A0AA35V7J1_METCP|nr:protein of unknown function [Methylococcus capsulatus]
MLGMVAGRFHLVAFRAAKLPLDHVHGPSLPVNMGDFGLTGSVPPKAAVPSGIPSNVTGWDASR